MFCFRHEHYHHNDPATERKLDHILHTLIKMETTIMSAISDFAAKQKAHQDRQDVALDNILGDLKGLNDKIEALQTSAGTITPEDQALLDEIEAKSDAVTTKVEALDNATPPVPPPA